MLDPSRHPAEQRALPRKAMFVAAELWVGKLSTPVKIRNMSSRGALIEATTLPPAGTAVTLMRGPFQGTGVMSWAEAGRGGIALDDAIAVEDWIRGKVPEHQARVDALIAEIRKSGREPQSLGAPGPSLDQASSSIEEELRALAGLIDSLETALCEDPHVIAQHGAALQTIDQAQQRIAALVSRLSA